MGYNWQTVTCPICGKEFLPFPEHSLTDGHGNLVCTPHCSTTAFKREEERERKEKELILKRRQERYRERYEQTKQERLALNPGRPPIYYRKSVCLCSKDTGEVVKTFPSVSEASRRTGYGIQTISRVCHGTEKLTGDYTFRFENPSDALPDRRSSSNKGRHDSKEVLQFTLDGKFVARYESLTQAAIAVEANRQNLTKCCKHLGRTCKGFKWEFAEEVTDAN